MFAAMLKGYSTEMINIVRAQMADDPDTNKIIDAELRRRKKKETTD